MLKAYDKFNVGVFHEGIKTCSLYLEGGSAGRKCFICETIRYGGHNVKT